MLTLPCALTYKHHCNCSVAYVVITDILAYSIGGYIVVNVPIANGFINYVVTHYSDEPIFVHLIIMVITYKNPMSR